MDGRTYQSDNTDYKFTGKQRDTETGWDYFGARYYDARIANWGSIDPLFEKHIQWTPYNYVLRNPIVLIDPDGRQVYFSDVEKIRKEQLTKLQLSVNPKYSYYLQITTNENGIYILDRDIINMPQKCTDEIFTIIAGIANGDELVSANFVCDDQWFHDNQRLTFDGINKERKEKGKDDILVGLILASGKVKNEQSPEIISSTSRTDLYVSKNLSEKEIIKTLGHELGHAYSYIIGSKWLHMDQKEAEEYYKRLERKAGENYEKHKKKSEH